MLQGILNIVCFSKVVSFTAVLVDVDPFARAAAATAGAMFLAFFFEGSTLSPLTMASNAICSLVREWHLHLSHHHFQDWR